MTKKEKQNKVEAETINDWSKKLNDHLADSEIKIRFKKMTPTAKIPAATNAGDIGFDVYCNETVSIAPQSVKKVSTGIQLADMPNTDDKKNHIFMKIEGRSGLTIKGVFPIGGIIDPTYRGEVAVVLANLSPERVEFVPGDRIAQLVVYKVGCSPEVVMGETDVVTETTRGSLGFGSSGV